MTRRNVPANSPVRHEPHASLVAVEGFPSRRPHGTGSALLRALAPCADLAGAHARRKLHRVPRARTRAQAARRARSVHHRPQAGKGQRGWPLREPRFPREAGLSGLRDPHRCRGRGRSRARGGEAGASGPPARAHPRPMRKPAARAQSQGQPPRRTLGEGETRPRRSESSAPPRTTCARRLPSSPIPRWRW